MATLAPPRVSAGFISFSVNDYARSRRKARTLERLVRADKKYRRFLRGWRRDRSLGGVVTRRLIDDERVWMPRPGTQASIRMTTRRKEELASVRDLIELAGGEASAVRLFGSAGFRETLKTTGRLKIRFPGPEELLAATATESPALNFELTNEKRGLLAVELPRRLAAFSGAQDDYISALRRLEFEYKAQIVEDIQYDPEIIQFAPDDADGESLDEVLGRIRASEAWDVSRGSDIAIAIIDTGINGARDEFPMAKRLGGWSPPEQEPWEDTNGHGTMCACIAAARKDQGSRSEFNGVAPDAGLYACRTQFYSTEITSIYDYLIDEVEATGRRIVASNSWGIRTGRPPREDPDVSGAIKDAFEAGIVPVFSAGNYHQLAGGGARTSRPSSIWLHKSWDRVITVAASRLDDDQVWHYSSRGPGQWHGREGAERAKPDVCAPSPPNGRILYGDRVRNLLIGWGTSGSAPQVSGLCALLLARNPKLTADELSDIIRRTANTLGLDPHCEGKGIIDCAAALASI